MSTIIKDCIYRFIKVPDLCKQFINTKEFQRLRNIKQLGYHYQQNLNTLEFLIFNKRPRQCTQVPDMSKPYNPYRGYSHCSSRPAPDWKIGAVLQISLLI